MEREKSAMETTIEKARKEEENRKKSAKKSSDTASNLEKWLNKSWWKADKAVEEAILDINTDILIADTVPVKDARMGGIVGGTEATWSPDMTLKKRPQTSSRSLPRPTANTHISSIFGWWSLSFNRQLTRP